MIRVVEHHDWVIYCIIGIILSYIIIFKTLHRDVTLIEFILQPYEESNNNTLSWVFTTILFSVSFSALFSQFIPIVPKFITQNLIIAGITFNKFGFVLFSLLLFQLIKNIFVYLFYGSINQLERFGRYSFVAQKYFMVYSLVILVISFLHYCLHFKTSTALVQSIPDWSKILVVSSVTTSEHGRRYFSSWCFLKSGNKSAIDFSPKEIFLFL